MTGRGRTKGGTRSRLSGRRAAFFDRVAPLYDLCMWLWPSGDLARLLDLEAGALVLDAGGGTGRAVAGLGAGSAFSCVVYDCSEPMLQRCRRRGALSPVAGTVCALPFADGIFDAAVAAEAWHHFSCKDAAMRELLRVLRPGGRLLIEEPDVRRFAGRAVAWAERVGRLGSSFEDADAIRARARALGARPAGESTGWLAVRLVVRKPVEPEG